MNIGDTLHTAVAEALESSGARESSEAVWLFGSATRSAELLSDVDLLLVIYDAGEDARQAALRFRTAVQETVEQRLDTRVDVVILTAGEEATFGFATRERGFRIWPRVCPSAR